MSTGTPCKAWHQSIFSKSKATHRMWCNIRYSRQLAICENFGYHIHAFPLWFCWPDRIWQTIVTVSNELLLASAITWFQKAFYYILPIIQMLPMIYQVLWGIKFLLKTNHRTMMAALIPYMSWIRDNYISSAAGGSTQAPFRLRCWAIIDLINAASKYILWSRQIHFTIRTNTFMPRCWAIIDLI